ncbi:hypothetical protein, partial [Rhizobium rhizogenes]|uniref:hypothetical protein n=1 Tax=Rhizobium rhizogenes TaxID=359 RepID=UPI001A9C54A7
DACCSWVNAAFVFMKKEKRGRRHLPYQSGYRSNSVAYYVFDGRLTGAIYVLKSTGRFILG